MSPSEWNKRLRRRIQVQVPLYNLSISLLWLFLILRLTSTQIWDRAFWSRAVLKFD